MKIKVLWILPPPHLLPLCGILARQDLLQLLTFVSLFWDVSVVTDKKQKTKNNGPSVWPNYLLYSSVAEPGETEPHWV